jgi:hypothetical protein
MEDFDGAFALMARERVGAFLAVASPLLVARRVPLAEFAKKHRLPGMFGSKENVQAGGLISYGADLTDLNRRAATYIDKILSPQAVPRLRDRYADRPPRRHPCQLRVQDTATLRVMTRPRRRGDRVSLLSLLHLLRSGSGTKLTSYPHSAMSAFGGKADIGFGQCNVRF